MDGQMMGDYTGRLLRSTKYGSVFRLGKQKRGAYQLEMVTPPQTPHDSMPKEIGRHGLIVVIGLGWAEWVDA